MLPRTPNHYIRDGIGSYTKPLTKLSAGCPGVTKLTHKNHLFGVELGIGMFFAASSPHWIKLSWKTFQQSFLGGISGVILWCTKKKMIRSYTQFVVTRMADIQSFWNRTIKQFIGHSVCSHWFLPIRNCSIASPSYASFPFPATRCRFTNAIPKEFWKYPSFHAFIIRYVSCLCKGVPV